MSRRKLAIHLFLREAALLAGILGAFALLSEWRVGLASVETLVLAGAALMAASLGVEWALVRSHWKRLGSDYGGGRSP